MSRSVSTYLTKINNKIFLPGLQREFVWNPDQIEELFDSLIREYPIGIITEWEVSSGQVADYTSYEFLEFYVASDHQPPAAITSSKFEKFNKETNGQDPDFLIIDGQQRLNSLWIGACGEIAQYSGGRGYPKDDPENWESYQLCIDLFGHPELHHTNTTDDYIFKFKSTGGLGGKDERGYSEVGSVHHLWMPIGDLWISESQAENETGRLVEQSEMRNVVDNHVDDAAIPVDKENTIELKDIAKTTARDLYNKVLDANINIDNTKKDRSEIPEIFQRLNMEGSDPKPYQLFMSQLMSYWPYDDDPDLRINPRKEIEQWIDDFQQKYPEYEKEIDRELFLRYSAYLMGIDLLKSNLPISESEMDQLRQYWLQDDPITMGTDYEWFRKSLEKAFETIISTGIRPQVMNTMPIFALLGLFYYRNPDAEVSDENRNAVFQFIAKGLLLNKTYRALTHGKSRNWMRYLNDWNPANTDSVIFPGDELFDDENLSPAPDDIRRAVENTKYAGTAGEPVFTDENAVAVLGLIDESYTTSAVRDISNYQVDHIFPSSRSEEVNTAGKKDVDLDQIGNLQLLPQSMNEAKGSQWPQDWLNTLSDSEAEELKRINQYPNIDLEPKNAADFVESRQHNLIKYFEDKYVD